MTPNSNFQQKSRSQSGLISLVEYEAELCAGSLHTFVCLAWHLVEPHTPFQDNWHIGLICEYLQAVTNLEINNLLINVPPRHMKSLLVSVFWPAWSWIRSPHLRWLTGSYAMPLAVRDALKSRRILQRPGTGSTLGGHSIYPVIRT